MATTAPHTWRAFYSERRHALGDASSKLLVFLFGCRHRRMGRPITREGHTYRACLSCGMTRDFDAKTWTTFGPYRQR